MSDKLKDFETLLAKARQAMKAAADLLKELDPQDAKAAALLGDLSPSIVNDLRKYNLGQITLDEVLMRAAEEQTGRVNQ